MSHESPGLRHQKSPPSGAVPAGLDARQDPGPSLSQETITDLQAIAQGLAIPGWQDLDRDGLIDALRSYWKQTRGEDAAPLS